MPCTSELGANSAYLGNRREVEAPQVLYEGDLVEQQPLRGHDARRVRDQNPEPRLRALPLHEANHDQLYHAKREMN